MSTIMDRVRGDKTVKFVRFQRGELWYATEDGFEFPVPVSDTGDATFKAEDRALFFMRWIRKHMEMIIAAKTDSIRAENAEYLKKATL